MSLFSYFLDKKIQHEVSSEICFRNFRNHIHSLVGFRNFWNPSHSLFGFKNFWNHFAMIENWFQKFPKPFYLSIGFRNFRNQFIHQLVSENSETILFSDWLQKFPNPFPKPFSLTIQHMGYAALIIAKKKRIHWYICFNKKSDLVSCS